jgi:hypothetical protein
MSDKSRNLIIKRVHGVGWTFLSERERDRLRRVDRQTTGGTDDTQRSKRKVYKRGGRGEPSPN